MDKGYAILVLNACFRASRELGEVATMTGDFAGDDGPGLKSQLGMAVGEISRITETIYSLHPDLHGYVEQQIETYGRVS